MLARVCTSVLCGIEAVPVDVEVEVRDGPNRFLIVGLADNAVKEARERVSAALARLAVRLPEQILVNLSPAGLKKEGSHFDLPIAVGVLIASKVLPPSCTEHRSFHGELGLDGALKPVHGTVIRAIDAYQRGIRQLVIPYENGTEANLVERLQVCAMRSLREVISLCKGEGDFLLARVQRKCDSTPPEDLSLNDVRGQEAAKRALLISAIGGHHLLMVGPPGCGKSMLAARLPTLLPRLSRQEVLEVVKIHSLAGLQLGSLLAGIPPVRAPHYGSSVNALVGGGAVPRPGEVSLAHRGVLFLDEFPEFPRAAIEALRLPLESRCVSVARVRQSVTFPAHFQLVAAMNPCPCGRLGVVNGAPCLCSRPAVQAYLSKLSRPILDRIDVQVELQPVSFEALHGQPRPAASGDLRSEVAAARELQWQRQGCLNAELSAKSLTESIYLDESARTLLERSMEKLGLSARGSVRVLRVARTIADLAQSKQILAAHLAEALSYRALGRIEQHVTSPVAAAV